MISIFHFYILKLETFLPIALISTSNFMANCIKWSIKVVEFIGMNFINYFRLDFAEFMSIKLIIMVDIISTVFTSMNLIIKV